MEDLNDEQNVPAPLNRRQRMSIVEFIGLSSSSALIAANASIYVLIDPLTTNPDPHVAAIAKTVEVINSFFMGSGVVALTLSILKLTRRR